ncbi:MAG: extracellular solute-binding protein [Clostridium sp.]|jgi:multiple sugar transport system substrate-binding protein|nr:extracellular solute-binding protein [Clostridium sp.]
MKNAWVKGLAIAAAAAMTVSFTACTGKAEDPGSAAGETAKQEGAAEEKDFSGKKLSVGIWGGNDQESAAIEKVKADFEQRTGAVVELKVYTDYNTQIQADFIAKTAPDVFYIDGSMFPFYGNLGVMEPLDPQEMGADSYYENLLQAFTTEDGTLYCIPKDVSTLATYYNKGILESVGVSPDDIPAALEDYQAFLTDLQERLDEKYGEGQVAAMTYNQDLARNLYILEEKGGKIMDENENATLSSDAVVGNLQLILDMAQAGCWKTPSDLGLGWNGEAFGTGKTAIMEEGNWVYGTLRTDYSDIDFEVTEMPTYNGSQHSMCFTVGYGISAVSNEKELAKEWIKYATGTEGMATWCQGAGTLPSRADVAEAIKVQEDPVWQVHSKMIDIATPWQKGTTIDIVNSAYQNFLPLAVKGEKTGKEAMEQVDKQANSEIANAK